MKDLALEKEMEGVIVKIDKDLKKLENELENILSKYPRFFSNSVEKLSKALDKQYQAH